MRRNHTGWFLLGVGVTLGGFLLALGLMVAINFNNLGSLSQVIRLVQGQYVEEVDSGLLVEGAMRGIIEALEDPYSEFLSTGEFDSLLEQVKGTFGGIGILVGMRNDSLTVIQTYENTPAYEAGIQAGDVILTVDGEDTNEMDLETAVLLMRGEPGSTVKLAIQRSQNEESLEVAVERRQIQIPTVEGELMADGLAYVRVSQFTENTSKEFVNKLNSFEEIRGLVLDLRDNPGGDLFSAVEIADLFIAEGPIVHIDYRSNQDQTFDAGPQELDLPVVVLINQNSASASEIVAGALKDTEKAILVGTKTYGKGVVQNVFELRGGTGLKLTTARYLTPSGHYLDRQGIAPHIEIEDSLDFEEDPPLEKALEVLKAGN